MPKDKEFVQGMRVFDPREGAPDFVIADVAFDVIPFTVWLKENMNAEGKINAQIKRGKSGKLYAEKNGFRKEMPETKVDSEDIRPEDIPFS